MCVCVGGGGINELSIHKINKSGHLETQHPNALKNMFADCVSVRDRHDKVCSS